MPSESARAAIRVGDWIVDPALDTVSRGGETLKLEPRTMRLLMYLVDAAGAVVSQDTLLTEVWAGVVVGPASVYQAVSQLRKILGDTDPAPSYIATVPRKGYRLIAPVSRAESATLPTLSGRRPRPWLIAGGAVLMTLAAIAWFPLRRLLSDASASVVVLPFVDMTAQKADQPFCDGLTEELSNWLAQIPTLRVVARTSAFSYKGRNEDVRQIGRALNIDHVVEGSMRRYGDRMRVTVELIDARNGYHLWSANYDRPVDDTIKMQEEISHSVAENLRIRLTASTEQRFSARKSSSPKAYQLFLLAQHDLQERTRDSTEKAIGLYKQVLGMDPQFALARVRLGLALMNQGYFNNRPTAELATDVDPLIAAALQVDPRLSEAYALRGALRHDEERIAEALDDLHLAVSLNPNDSTAFSEMGRVFLMAGQPREALDSFTQVAALDPLDLRAEQERCAAFTDLARYDEATVACERARMLAPASSLPLDEFAWLAAARGKIDEALRWNLASIKAEPDNFDRYWMRVDLFLTLARPRGARDAVTDSRAAAKDDEDADAALARVIYCESGQDGLRAHLNATQLERSAHAVSLLEAAYSRLILGEPAAARELIKRATAAPDRAPGLDDSPWYARAGTSYRLDLATADLQLGDRGAATRELRYVRSMLDKMISAGVQRHAVFELRAKVLALQGDADAAMRDLQLAAQLGWRRTWWAEHEPYLAALRTRSDYQALIARISRSNDEISERLK